MLSFELKKSDLRQGPEVMEIFLDQEGLESLLAQLKFLHDKRTDHVHMMSGSWGGTHLDDVAQIEGNSVVHQVTVYLRDTAAL